MTIEKLEKLNSDMEEKIAAAKGLTERVIILCSFIRKLENNTLSQNLAYEEKRSACSNEAYQLLKTNILKVQTLFEGSSQRFYLEDNEENQLNWRKIYFNEKKEKIKKANDLIKKIDYDKRRWEKLNSHIAHLPENPQKNECQKLLETILPLIDKLEELKAPLKLFGLRKKHYTLAENLEKKKIATKDAKTIITDSIQELQKASEITHDQNVAQKITQLINNFQALQNSLPENISRENSRNKQLTFSNQNFFIERNDSIFSSQGTEMSDDVDTDIEPDNYSASNNRKRKVADDISNSSDTAPNNTLKKSR